MMSMYRLTGPEPGDVSVEEAYAAPLGRRADRPWVALCMVASIDGSAVVGGVSGTLSSPVDQAVLGRLRRLADVVVVGSSTVRGEGYGPPRKTGLRIGVVTARGSIDHESALFASGAGFVITTDTGPVPEGIDAVRAGTGSVDLTVALGRLGEVVAHPVHHVQLEGGPSLNAAFAAAGLIDEINVTTSPLLAGGPGQRIVAGAPDVGERFELAQLAVDEQSFTYARWVRRR